MPKKITKAILPVGGFGTRFLPATKSQPKEMLPVVDKPVIQYLVEEAVASGIEDIIFVTGRGKRAIEDHFDVAYELEKTLVEKNKHDLLASVQDIAKMARFSYVRQPYPLGDGHAVLQAAHLVDKDEPVLVLFGDCIYDSTVPAARQVIDAYEQQQAPIIGVSSVADEDVSKFGVIEGDKTKEGVTKMQRMREKPEPSETDSRLVAVGKYVITPDVFDVLSTMKDGVSGEIRLADAFAIMLGRDAVIFAKELDGMWLDTGDKYGLIQATIHFGLKHPDLKKRLEKYIKDVR